METVILCNCVCTGYKLVFGAKVLEIFELLFEDWEMKQRWMNTKKGDLKAMKEKGIL